MMLINQVSCKEAFKQAKDVGRMRNEGDFSGIFNHGCGGLHKSEMDSNEGKVYMANSTVFTLSNKGWISEIKVIWVRPGCPGLNKWFYEISWVDRINLLGLEGNRTNWLSSRALESCLVRDSKRGLINLVDSLPSFWSVTKRNRNKRTMTSTRVLCLDERFEKISIGWLLSPWKNQKIHKIGRCCPCNVVFACLLCYPCSGSNRSIKQQYHKYPRMHTTTSQVTILLEKFINHLAMIFAILD